MLAEEPAPPPPKRGPAAGGTQTTDYRELRQVYSEARESGGGASFPPVATGEPRASTILE